MDALLENVHVILKECTCCIVVATLFQTTDVLSYVSHATVVLFWMIYTLYHLLIIHDSKHYEFIAVNICETILEKSMVS